MCEPPSNMYRAKDKKVGLFIGCTTNCNCNTKWHVWLLHFAQSVKFTRGLNQPESPWAAIHWELRKDDKDG